MRWDFSPFTTLLIIVFYSEIINYLLTETEVAGVLLIIRYSSHARCWLVVQERSAHDSFNLAE